MKDYKETILGYYQKLLEDLPRLKGRNYNKFGVKSFTNPRLRKVFDVDLSQLRTGTVLLKVELLSQTEEERTGFLEKRSGFGFTLYIREYDKLKDFSVFKGVLPHYTVPLKIEVLANSDNDSFYTNNHEIPEEYIGPLMADFSNIVKEVVKELPDKEIYLNADKNYDLIDNFFKKYDLKKKN